MDSAKQLRDLSKVYMEAVYGGGKKEEKKDTRLVVTAADKKANTKAYQNYKAGNKAYKAADHLGEGKKAEKDFDGDGKLESPEAEYKGSKDKAIKKELKDLQKAAETGKDEYVAKANKVKVVGEEKKSSMTTYKYSDKFYKAIKKDDKEPKITPKKQLLNKEDVNDEYIDTVQKIKAAETEADIKRWKALEESGNFTVEELQSIKEADIADILARLEKKRISKGGDPEESPLPAMRKYHADKKKKKVKEEVESIEEADSLAGQVARWEAARQKRMKQRQSYERPSWIPRDQDHEDNWGSSKGEKKK